MENFIKKGILGKDGGFDNYSKRPRIGGRQGDTVRCSFEPTGADAGSSFFSIIAFLGNTPKGEGIHQKAMQGGISLHVLFSSKDKDSSCRLPLPIPIQSKSAAAPRHPQFALVSKTQSQKLEKNLKILFSPSF
jgi:hypothetical protein